TLIDLMEWIEPPAHGEPTHRRPGSDLAHIGYARMALMTTGIDGEYERLRAAGVEFISPPVTMSDGATRYCCFYDPDGTILERRAVASVLRRGGLRRGRRPHRARPAGLDERRAHHRARHQLLGEPAPVSGHLVRRGVPELDLPHRDHARAAAARSRAPFVGGVP